MKNLFEETRLAGMTLANRFVRSATWEGMAGGSGEVTEQLTDYLVDLTRGGVGLIITGHAYVHRHGQAGRRQLGIYDDTLIPGLRGMTEKIHDKGGKIVLQLAHAGFFAHPKLTGRMPLVVSETTGQDPSSYTKLTGEAIGEIVRAFAEAAARAKMAGFDGVQIHAAHGYLLSQFLSPAFNRRHDEYGGSIENRARALLETYQEIRRLVGREYPVLVKMNCADFCENGLSLEDSIEVGKMLEAAGIDAIELSGGLLTGGAMSPSRVGINRAEKEAYFRSEAKAFRRQIKVPLLLVGGIRSYEVAEELLAEGTADFISLCRPLIREPGLINRWKDGDHSRATCVSDNQCFVPALKGDGVYCVKDRH